MTDTVIKSFANFHKTYGMFANNGDNAAIYKNTFRL